MIRHRGTRRRAHDPAYAIRQLGLYVRLLPIT